MTHKPDPEGLNLVMDRISADPGSTMVLGDHAVDMQAGVNASIAFRAGITHGFGKAEQLIEAGANLIVTSLDELSARLTK